MAFCVITPEASLNPGQLKQLRDYVATVLQDVVRGSTRQNTVIRPLLATDVMNGTSTADFTNPVALTANTISATQYSTWQLGQTQAVAIFGFGYTAASPAIREIWLGTSAVYAKVRLNPLLTQGSARSRSGYFNPIWFIGQDTPVIQYLADANVNASTETFELIGLVAEQANQKIVNQPSVSDKQLPNTVSA
jgi:hypothetical protein